MERAAWCFSPPPLLLLLLRAKVVVCEGKANESSFGEDVRSLFRVSFPKRKKMDFCLRCKDDDRHNAQNDRREEEDKEEDKDDARRAWVK